MKTIKTMLVLLLSAGMILSFAACGGSSSDEDTAAGTSASPEEEYDIYTFDGVGFSYELPEDMHIEKGHIDKLDQGELSYGSGVRMGYPVYYDNSDPSVPAATFVIICVKDCETEKEASERLTAAMTEVLDTPLTQKDIDAFSSIKEIYRENGYMWLMAKRDKTPVSEDCQAEYDALYDASEDIINYHMKFFAPEEWQGYEEDAAVSFETTDLDGNPVKSEDLFTKNKVTMINLWATYCGPCIGEMPKIEEMSQEFASKGGGIVGIVVDVPTDNDKYLENARTIVKETGVTYPIVKAWEGLDQMLPSQGIPMTYFVDSKGKLIGQPVLGAQVNTYPKEMEDLLSQTE